MILAGTPLGNLRDASPRLVDALATAAVIAAEDTRRVRRLCADLGVAPRAGSSPSSTATSSTAFPSCSTRSATATTSWSSPTPACHRCPTPATGWWPPPSASGVAVTTLPGPSAVTTALAVSGLPVHRFCFEGFLPRKAGERRRLLDALAAEPRTMVFFEAPHRLAADARRLGRRVRSGPAGRGVPRTDEDLRGGPARARSASWPIGPQDEVRGEITLVVVGAAARSGADSGR